MSLKKKFDIDLRIAARKEQLRKKSAPDIVDVPKKKRVWKKSALNAVDAHIKKRLKKKAKLKAKIMVEYFKKTVFERRAELQERAFSKNFFLEDFNSDLFEELSTYTAILVFRIKQNNFFITLISRSTLKVCKIWSCGLAKLHASKKNLKFIVNALIIQLLIYFKNKFRSAKFIFVIRGMSFLKKNMITRLAFFFRQREPIFILKSAKIFNGCRSKKLRRKKHSKSISSS